MSRFGFIAGSLLFHALLFLLALSLPPPFPATPAGKETTDLTFVQMTDAPYPDGAGEGARPAAGAEEVKEGPPVAATHEPGREKAAKTPGAATQGPGGPVKKSAAEPAGEKTPAEKTVAPGPQNVPAAPEVPAKVAPEAPAKVAPEAPAKVTPEAPDAHAAASGTAGQGPSVPAPAKKTWDGGADGSPLPEDSVTVPVSTAARLPGDKDAPARAATEVLDIYYSKSGDSYQVVIEGDGEFRAPEVFVVENEKLVVDLPGVKSARRAINLEIGGRTLDSVRMYVHREPVLKVRVVLDLAGTARYEVYSRPDGLSVNINPAASPAVEAVAPEKAAPKEKPEAPPAGRAKIEPAPRPPATGSETKPARQKADKPGPAGEAGGPALGLSQAGDKHAAVRADRASVNFKHHQGWPVPAMVKLRVDAPGPGRRPVKWRAVADSDWIIVSPVTGTVPGALEVGVDVSRAALGYRESSVTIYTDGGAVGIKVAVTLMVMPDVKGTPELPHYSWDKYMNGDCKVCHLPKQLLPSEGFMMQPEFCGLCHNPAGTAAGSLPGPGGHPVLVDVNSGGAKMPTGGTIPRGTASDRMDTHLKDGRLVVCVTCHNVMEKPGDFARTWEITSTTDQVRYELFRGGWENMGYMKPRVYAASGLKEMPRYLKDAGRMLVSEDKYGYDEAEGVITFKHARPKHEFVYVTLVNPYLRVSTHNNALCYDCHGQNTHMGMNCLVCHAAHGTDNIMCIRGRLRTPSRQARPVVFRGYSGTGSFADGGAVRDGVCEVCHTRTRYHRAGAGGRPHHEGSRCTRCHTHENGFAPRG